MNGLGAFNFGSVLDLSYHFDIPLTPHMRFKKNVSLIILSILCGSHKYLFLEVYNVLQCYKYTMCKGAPGVYSSVFNIYKNYYYNYLNQFYLFLITSFSLKGREGPRGPPGPTGER